MPETPLRELSRPERAPRILYIEDDVVAAELFKTRMEKDGYIVDLAHTGQEGIRRLGELPYDLVALDYQLPEMTGLNVLRAIVNDEEHPPAIMVTSDDDAAVVVEALRLGIADYVIKSSDEAYLQQLPIVAKRIIQQHRGQQKYAEFVDELHDQNRKLALLNRATQIFSSTLDEAQIALQLVSSICEFTDTEGSSVWLWADDVTGKLECVAIFSQGEHIEPHHVQLSAGQGIAGWAAQTEQTLVVNEAPLDPRFSSTSDEKLNFRTQSLLAVPLRAPDKTLGVLELVNKRSGHFSEGDRILAETLAASAAIAIENARFVQDLNRQTEELRLRNEELDAFAHTVAHDLKTPLSLVTGYADMLRENFDVLHPDEISMYLNQLIDNSMRMNHIIESLLLLAGVRGASHVEIEPLQMHDVVMEAMNRVEFMLAEREAIVHIPDDWPEAMGYGPWLEEVWYNYVINALKYGGNPPELRLGHDEPTDGQIRFWIEDNGPGVPADPALLFKPTIRAQRNNERRGYGLGLSIVKRIVERLQGMVGAQNIPDGGSRFYFTLPVAPPDESSTA